MIPASKLLTLLADPALLNVMVLAADHRAASDAVQVAARFKAAGVASGPRVAWHLFADIDASAAWSVIVKEATKADVLVVSFGEECGVPDRLRNLVDYANRMRADDFRGVIALSAGWITGATRRWLMDLTGPDGFDHLRPGREPESGRRAVRGNARPGLT